MGNIVAKRLQLSYFEDNIPHYLRKQKKETLFTSKVSVPCSMEDVSQKTTLVAKHWQPGQAADVNGGQ